MDLVGPLVDGGAGQGAQPEQLEGFLLSDDGDELWAVSGANEAPAGITVLRLGTLGFEQLGLNDSSGAFESRSANPATGPGTPVASGFRGRSP